MVAALTLVPMLACHMLSLRHTSTADVPAVDFAPDSDEMVHAPALAAIKLLR
jgi:hypothetical protein